VDTTRVVPVTRIVDITRIVPVTPSPAPVPIEGIYFSAGRNLYRMNLDGSDLEIVAMDIGRVTERLFIDTTNRRLYMSRWDASAQILIFDLESRNVSTYIDGPANGGQGLAIDPAASRMYLGLYYDGVYAMDMNDVGKWTQLVSPASLSPLHGQRGQLQFDSVNRHIYFRTAYNYDCDSCRYVWRVDPDGGNLTRIIPANGGDALVLDLREGKMYFSDQPANGTIMRANLDGSGVEQVFAIPAPYRFCRSMALDSTRGKLYLFLLDEDSGYTGRAIARLNTDGTEFEMLFFSIAGTTEEEVAGDLALFLPQ
jgi:hypothetical protein